MCTGQPDRSDFVEPHLTIKNFIACDECDPAVRRPEVVEILLYSRHYTYFSTVGMSPLTGTEKKKLAPLPGSPSPHILPP